MAWEPLRICIGDGTTGYIFFKLEGTSAASNDGRGFPNTTSGGFGGQFFHSNNNIRKITLDLTARGVAKGEIKIRIFTRWWISQLNGTTNIEFRHCLPMVSFHCPSTPVANNYVSMFTHEHTENWNGCVQEISMVIVNLIAKVFRPP